MIHTCLEPVGQEQRIPSNLIPTENTPITLEVEETFFDLPNAGQVQPHGGAYLKPIGRVNLFTDIFPQVQALSIEFIEPASGPFQATFSMMNPSDMDRRTSESGHLDVAPQDSNIYFSHLSECEQPRMSWTI